MHKSAFVRARVIGDQESPLELKIPNEETRKTLEETDQGIGLNECSGIEGLFKKLGI